MNLVRVLIRVLILVLILSIVLTLDRALDLLLRQTFAMWSAKSARRCRGPNPSWCGEYEYECEYK